MSRWKALLCGLYGVGSFICPTTSGSPRMSVAVNDSDRPVWVSTLRVTFSPLRPDDVDTTATAPSSRPELSRTSFAPRAE